ncbi:MAG: DUF4956 domain-containing protein [Ignavibacteria bacterium]|nr:DUF4956 domain-containing protein [Ignavibacteria bacterium]
MLQELEQLVTFSVSFEQVIENALVALLCGGLVAFFYRACFRGRLYSPTFAHSLVLLSMITTIVIMVIGSNLARAFGLVGAMAIIRFRTAVKEMQEIIFIFFALAVGMAAGRRTHAHRGHRHAVRGRRRRGSLPHPAVDAEPQGIPAAVHVPRTGGRRRRLSRRAEKALHGFASPEHAERGSGRGHRTLLPRPAA